MAEFEPITMLYQMAFGQNGVAITRLSQGKAEIRRLHRDELLLTRAAWEPLARQARAYRNFYIKAYTLREVTNMKQRGIFVSDRALERATDEYVAAIRECERFNPIVPVRDFDSKKDQ